MFPQRLIKVREERELLQKDVAAHLGITTSAYGFYEQGKREPDVETLRKLADFFDVSIDFLLGRSTKGRGNQGKENPIADLPPEARKSVEDYINFLRQQHGGKTK